MTRIFFSLIFFVSALGVHAQVASDSISLSFNPLTSSILMSNSGILTNLRIKTDAIDMSGIPGQSVVLRQQSLLPTAFFCKLEHRLDKSARMPLRFRLGDIDYTDAIEGKNRYDVRTFTADQRTKE